MGDLSSFTLIKPIVGQSMVKFKVLDDLFKNVVIRQDTVVFYIDVYAIVCRCYNPNMVEKINHMNPKMVLIDFVVSIMNCLGHYRFFTVKNLGKKSKIVLTHETKLTPYQEQLYPDYRYDRIKKFDLDNPVYGDMNKILMDAYKFVQSICTYLEGIYVIDPDIGVDGDTIAALLRNADQFKDCFHVLFTRNLAATQLVSDDTVVFFNKREDSVVLTRKNCLTEGIFKRRCSKETKQKFAKQISPSLIPYICMLAGCEHYLKPFKRNFPIDVAAKLIIKMLENGDITRNVALPTFLEQLERYQHLAHDKKKDLNLDLPYYDKDDYNELINRYRVISIPLNALAATKSQILAIYKRLVDVYNQPYLDDVSDMLSALKDPDRLIDFDKLNANKPYEDEDYDGSWW